MNILMDDKPLDEKPMNTNTSTNDTNKTAEKNPDYSVQELLAQLAADESWEADPEYRQKAIGMLVRKLPAC